MKFILFLLSLNISLSYAQKFQFGPELGFNLINVETQDIGDNFQVGWHTGGVAQYEFKSWFGVSAGLYYTQKRQAFEKSETISNVLSLALLQQGLQGIDLNTYSKQNGRITLNTLQVPLLAVFKHKEFNLKVGGYVGYVFNSRTKTTEIKNTPFVSTIDISTLLGGDPLLTGAISSFIPPANETLFTESTNNSGLSSLDFGLKAGIGYQVNSIGFNANYTYGLTDYRSSSTGSQENNSYFQFSIHYLFGKGSLKKTSYSRL